jgi:hypothetical protein
MLYSGAMRIDLWRMLIVYRYGGMYTDIDNWPTQEFVEATIKHEDQAFFLRDGWGRPSQWLFAMAPRHPIAYFTINEIIKRVLNLTNVLRPKLVFTTGPDALKHGYGQAMSWSVGNKSWEHQAQQSYGTHNVTARILSAPSTARLVYFLSAKLARSQEGNVTMSAKEKIENESGLAHWNKIIYKASKGKRGMSCRALLAQAQSPVGTVTRGSEN